MIISINFYFVLNVYLILCLCIYIFKIDILRFKTRAYFYTCSCFFIRQYLKFLIIVYKLNYMNMTRSITCVLGLLNFLNQA